LACENQCICLSHNKANRQLKTKASKWLQNGVKLNSKSKNRNQDQDKDKREREREREKGSDRQR